MNETFQPDRASDVPWPTSGDLPKNAAAGAHDTIHRLADDAAPVVRKLGDRVSAAGEALHATSDQLRDTREAWVAGMRTTVRNNPLVTVAAALALGAAIARITR
jgi:hypothetical protein